VLAVVIEAPRDLQYSEKLPIAQLAVVTATTNFEEKQQRQPTTAIC